MTLRLIAVVMALVSDTEDLGFRLVYWECRAALGNRGDRLEESFVIL